MAIIFPEGTQDFPGKACQIKLGTYTSQATINPGSSWIHSGLSVTITPTNSSNKILVLAKLEASSGNNNYITCARLYRGTTHVSGATSPSNGSRPGTWATHGTQDYNNYGRHDLIGAYIDSPSTTSATTYRVYVRDLRDNGNIYINRGYYDENSGSNPVGNSWMMAIELEDS